MSHKATNWLADINPKDLTNAEFRILFVLCDCHNPSAGCFPKQSYIMAKTGRGSSSVNDALTGLEGKGFIRREQRTNPKTGKREATRYILGFEMDGAQEPSPNSGEGKKGSKPEQTGAPTPNSGDGSISGFSADPSPVFGQNHLRKTGVVYKEEPVKEPVKEPCAAGASHHQDLNLVLDEIWAAYPRKGDQLATEEAARSLIEEGASPADLLAAVEAYAKKSASYDESRVKLSQNFFAGDFWRRHVPVAAKVASRDEILQARAKTILEGKTFLCRSITAHAAGECITAGLVTPQDCLQAGIAL
ncbi:helix-turn-helix domain-containing protein [Phaeobacter italicus]|uniref:helix-turn-helix domain-containing protein n=1 Tax=Phaeobacter italicus TaxID=481446 RepID=UPI001CD5384C|nr:helix-turn-helix domain-containing protein [Phaeobacter italicus]MCA0855869.1 helix-turn-helix domain-containing protein [Phaeobacter italicus]